MIPNTEGSKHSLSVTDSKLQCGSTLTHDGDAPVRVEQQTLTHGDFEPQNKCNPRTHSPCRTSKVRSTQPNVALLKLSSAHIYNR